MGLNPTILRQAQAFAFLFQPTDPAAHPPPLPRERFSPYVDSGRIRGVAFASTPAGPNGQGAVFADGLSNGSNLP
jgi:hypothetical protein